MKTILLPALLLLGIGEASAVPPGHYVEIKNGFVTGQDYLDMDEAQREAYAIGVVDGLLLAPFLAHAASAGTWPAPCVTGMTSRQVAAMLANELQRNPGAWHQSAHTSMYKALLAACPR